MNNIVEILKNCPEGTKLYSPIFGDVELIKVSNMSIIVRGEGGQLPDFYVDGRYHSNGECMLFPSKENRDWDKFMPFKDGDVIYTRCKSHNTFISIFREIKDEKIYTSCDLGASLYIREFNLLCKIDDVKEQRFATEEEKQKLFKAITDKGYRWNTETKTLEKLIIPKFKTGDRITNGKVIITIEYIDDRYYYAIGRKITSRIYINEQDNWQLAKFDVSTLIPFDKVLVRDSNARNWRCALYERYDNTVDIMKFATIIGHFRQCIPYEGNEHLLGTTNDCDDFYKTWE